jgi:type I restriction enzyme S subunit
MYGATVGKLGILRIKATTNQAICAIVKNNNISNKYLYWFLYFYRDTLIKRTFGGAQPNISQKVIRQIPILLPFKGDVPDLDAQNEIVHKIEAIYDEIKKANVEYQKQINLYSLLRKSILNYAFKGKL